jgi:hypothetical protein
MVVLTKAPSPQHAIETLQGLVDQTVGTIERSRRRRPAFTMRLARHNKSIE